MTYLINRNVSPTRPLTDDQLKEIIINTDIHLYPENELSRFKKLYAAYNQLDINQIELANGSDDWLQKIMIQFGAAGVLTIDPDFFMYQEYAEQLGRPFWQVSCDDQFEFSLEKIVAAIHEKQPSVLLVSNPQNPTGEQFAPAFLQRLADEMATINGHFVLDEAYIEFGEDYQRPDNDNVIIVRTLSKIFGLAGLRLGLAVAKGETFERLTKINHPYPVNNLALNIASALFKDRERLEDWLTYQKACQAELVEAFKSVSDLINVKETHCNFVFTYGTNAKQLGYFLAERGFVARMYDLPILKDAVRYSIMDLTQYPEFKALLLEWREQFVKKRTNHP